ACLKKRSEIWPQPMIARRTIGSLLDVDQLDLEDERRLRRDRGRLTLFAIGKLGGDDQLALAAPLPAGNAFVPALYHLAGAECEVDGLAAIERAVELLAVGERAGIVDGDRLASLRRGPGAHLPLHVLEPALRGNDLLVSGRRGLLLLRGERGGQA